MAKWADAKNKLIKIMLDLADIADEKQETPFSDEMGLGYRAFSMYVRGGVKAFIDQKADYHNAKERAERDEETLEANEKLLTKVFGTKVIAEEFTEEEIGKVKEVAAQIIASWKSEDD